MNNLSGDGTTDRAETLKQAQEAMDLRLENIVETALYADDLEAMEAFYSRVLHLERIAKEDGRHVFFAAGPSSVLLIFKPQATLKGDFLPAHGTTGPGHVAFGIRRESLDAWRNHLVEQGIAIEKEYTWPRGGRSIYFRDPAGNSAELITPGVWGTTSGW